MFSDRDLLIDALDAIDSGYRELAVFPVETLSHTDVRALVARLDKQEQKLAAVSKRLSGRLLSVARDRRALA